MAHRLAAVGLLLLVTVPGRAAAPDAATLARDMKAALEPARPSVRKMTLTVSTKDGDTVRLVAGQARKRLGDATGILTVVLAPADQRGIAFLMRERNGQPDVEQHVYLPLVRRERTILPVEGLQAFLGTDFTLADLGFVSLHGTYTLLGRASRNGVSAYEVREVPHLPIAKWYYSRIVVWIAADSRFPIERDFYDPAGTLWKVEHFDEISEIDGVPTVLRLRMEDKRDGGTTEITVSDVRYDVDVPDSLFDPATLRDAVSSPLW